MHRSGGLRNLWYPIRIGSGMCNKPPTLLLLDALIPGTALAQDWGVGFRLGDPSGVSVKKYWVGHAFEVSLGRTPIFSRAAYYNDRYDHWYTDQRFDHHAHEFIGYRASPALSLQMHYLMQKPIKNAANLDWYYGFGGQLRSQRYYYDHRYKPGNGSEWVVVQYERVTELDLGVDGVIGLEYTFKNAPVCLFTDATLFMEVIDNPFVFQGQFGLGARFLFGGAD